MPPARLPIPVTIITGALAAGKTTALCHLVTHTPADERICVVVNEFGAVGIDGALIESAGPRVVVKQIAGGCLCCISKGFLTAALAQIIRATKPDRLLIEPSGLGHPGGLVDLLAGEHLGSALRLHAIICLVDLTTFDPHALMSHTVFADQVNVADILVGSKADAAAQGAAEAFLAWSAGLFPPKARELTAEQGRLPAELLELGRGSGHAPLLSSRTQSSRRAMQGTAHAAAAAAAASCPPLVPAEPTTAATDEAAGGAGTAGAAAPAAAAPVPSPGQPVRAQFGGAAVPQPPGDAYASCGWVFDQGDVFDQARLLGLLQALQPCVARLKGVFRVGKGQWVAPVAPGSMQAHAADAGGDDQQQQQQQPAPPPPSSSPSASAPEAPQLLALQPICYRGASMAEVILAVGRQPMLAGGPGGAAAGPPAAAAGAAAGAREAARLASLGDWAPLERCFVGALAT